MDTRHLRTSKDSKDQVQVIVRIDREVYRHFRLKLLGEKHGVTVSSFIRKKINEYVND